MSSSEAIYTEYNVLIQRLINPILNTPGSQFSMNTYIKSLSNKDKNRLKQQSLFLPRLKMTELPEALKKLRTGIYWSFKHQAFVSVRSRQYAHVIKEEISHDISQWGLPTISTEDHRTEFPIDYLSPSLIDEIKNILLHDMESVFYELCFLFTGYNFVSDKYKHLVTQCLYDLIKNQGWAQSNLHIISALERLLCFQNSLPSSALGKRAYILKHFALFGALHFNLTSQEFNNALCFPPEDNCILHLNNLSIGQVNNSLKHYNRYSRNSIDIKETTSVDLADSYIPGCTFNTNFNNTNFYRSSMNNVTFKECTLTSCCFDYSNLTQVEFKKSKVTNSSFNQVSFLGSEPDKYSNSLDSEFKNTQFIGAYLKGHLSLSSISTQVQFIDFSGNISHQLDRLASWLCGANKQYRSLPYMAETRNVVLLCLKEQLKSSEATLSPEQLHCFCTHPLLANRLNHSQTYKRCLEKARAPTRPSFYHPHLFFRPAPQLPPFYQDTQNTIFYPVQPREWEQKHVFEPINTLPAQQDSFNDDTDSLSHNPQDNDSKYPSVNTPFSFFIPGNQNQLPLPVQAMELEQEHVFDPISTPPEKQNLSVTSELELKPDPLEFNELFLVPEENENPLNFYSDSFLSNLI